MILVGSLTAFDADQEVSLDVRQSSQAICRFGQTMTVHGLLDHDSSLHAALACACSAAAESSCVMQDTAYFSIYGTVNCGYAFEFQWWTLTLTLVVFCGMCFRLATPACTSTTDVKA